MIKNKCVAIFIGLIISQLLFSCSNDDEPTTSNKNSIEYYVRYELDTTSKYIFDNVNITVSTEKGLTTMSVPKTWEGTFGPFTKLECLQFSADLSYDDYVLRNTKFHGRISICRGNQPYILKADESFVYKPLNMTYQVIEQDLK